MTTNSALSLQRRRRQLLDFMDPIQNNTYTTFITVQDIRTYEIAITRPVPWPQTSQRDGHTVYNCFITTSLVHDLFTHGGISDYADRLQDSPEGYTVVLDFVRILSTDRTRLKAPHTVDSDFTQLSAANEFFHQTKYTKLCKRLPFLIVDDRALGRDRNGRHCELAIGDLSVDEDCDKFESLRALWCKEGRLPREFTLAENKDLPLQDITSRGSQSLPTGPSYRPFIMLNGKSREILDPKRDVLISPSCRNDTQAADDETVVTVGDTDTTNESTSTVNNTNDTNEVATTIENHIPGTAKTMPTTPQHTSTINTSSVDSQRRLPSGSGVVSCNTNSEGNNATTPTRKVSDTAGIRKRKSSGQNSKVSAYGKRSGRQQLFNDSTLFEPQLCTNLAHGQNVFKLTTGENVHGMGNTMAHGSFLNFQGPNMNVLPTSLMAHNYYKSNMPQSAGRLSLATMDMQPNLPETSMQESALVSGPYMPGATLTTANESCITTQHPTQSIFRSGHPDLMNRNMCSFDNLNEQETDAFNHVSIGSSGMATLMPSNLNLSNATILDRVSNDNYGMSNMANYNSLENSTWQENSTCSNHGALNSGHSQSDSSISPLSNCNQNRTFLSNAHNTDEMARSSHEQLFLQAQNSMIWSGNLPDPQTPMTSTTQSDGHTPICHSQKNSSTQHCTSQKQVNQQGLQHREAQQVMEQERPQPALDALGNDCSAFLDHHCSPMIPIAAHSTTNETSMFRGNISTQLRELENSERNAISLNNYRVNSGLSLQPADGVSSQAPYNHVVAFNAVTSGPENNSSFTTFSAPTAHKRDLVEDPLLANVDPVLLAHVISGTMNSGSTVEVPTASNGDLTSGAKNQQTTGESTTMTQKNPTLDAAEGSPRDTQTLPTSNFDNEVPVLPPCLTSFHQFEDLFGEEREDGNGLQGSVLDWLVGVNLDEIPVDDALQIPHAQNSSASQTSVQQAYERRSLLDLQWLLPENSAEPGDGINSFPHIDSNHKQGGDSDYYPHSTESASAPECIFPTSG